jgi:hypothetical protein
MLLALGVGIVLGTGIRLADGRAPGTRTQQPPTTAAVRPARRRGIPLPPVGVGLAAVAVTLETTGYVVRLTGATGSAARALSMDAPLSLPRMYIATLLATTALAAVAGAARNPGRRTWWLAVAVITALLASVKAGGTVHVTAVQWLEERITVAGATAVSAGIAVAVLAVLAVLSRAERRDRRRVLAALGAYAVASVALSAVSAAVAAPRWAAAATFVEESGEALASVSVLVAVLIGVAPRLVLPASWLLRRQDDDLSLEAAVARPQVTRE